ncbi:MAG: molybdopterin molybdotransferase MoeA [Acidobacteriota bacterium]|nr:molybdopterin molybdotransferase MoeA [Acidobacteriota bacterium]
MGERVLNFEQALDVVLEHARAVGTARQPEQESVALLDGVGRVLAEGVTADRDQPPFDRATRDGYAVRAADCGGPLRMVGSVRAGETWVGDAMAAGEAIEIMTGAPMPQGADAVAMVEHVLAEDGSVRLRAGRSLRAGENVVPQGAEARRDASVLHAGTVVGAAEIAVAASCGCATLAVFEKPRVAIVATGDELVEFDARPLAAQIRNSNSYALTAMVAIEGGHAARLAIARDTREQVRERIAEGREYDLLVLSGGVSMGKYDLVEEVLAELGAETFFTGALIQPGKPVVFGRLPKTHGTVDGSAAVTPARESGSAAGWTYFFGLPGNPVSTQVTFALFAAPFVRALAGRAEVAPRFVEARLAEDVQGSAKVTRFLPAELRGEWDAVTVCVVGWQGSGDIAANARGNCYAMLPAGVEDFRAGETVRVLLR